MMKEKALEVYDLRKNYGKEPNITPALKGASFYVDKGEFVAIMGRSGSGKTTLLDIVATLDKKTSGKIKLHGIDLDSLTKKQLASFRQKELGFIFQDFSLLDTMNSYDNIALPLAIAKLNKDEINKRVTSLANKLGISSILYKYPYELSGGDKQRVASCRALVTNPSLLLADEPTGSLDSKSSLSLLDSLSSINKNDGASILMVSHDAFACSYADRVIFLKDGQVTNEADKGSNNQKQFYERIIEAMHEAEA